MFWIRCARRRKGRAPTGDVMRFVFTLLGVASGRVAGERAYHQPRNALRGPCRHRKIGTENDSGGMLASLKCLQAAHALLSFICKERVSVLAFCKHPVGATMLKMTKALVKFSSDAAKPQAARGSASAPVPAMVRRWCSRMEWPRRRRARRAN